MSTVYIRIEKKIVKSNGACCTHNKQVPEVAINRSSAITGVDAVCSPPPDHEPFNLPGTYMHGKEAKAVRDRAVRPGKNNVCLDRALQCTVFLVVFFVAPLVCTSQLDLWEILPRQLRRASGLPILIDEEHMDRSCPPVVKHRPLHVTQII